MCMCARVHVCVDGAWGVAGTCVPFAWQEGVTAIVISWRRFFAIVALLVLYSIYGLPGLEGGVALSVALLESQAQFLTKPLGLGPRPVALSRIMFLHSPGTIGRCKGPHQCRGPRGCPDLFAARAPAPPRALRPSEWSRAQVWTQMPKLIERPTHCRTRCTLSKNS